MIIDKPVSRKRKKKIIPVYKRVSVQPFLLTRLKKYAPSLWKKGVHGQMNQIIVHQKSVGVTASLSRPGLPYESRGTMATRHFLNLHCQKNQNCFPESTSNVHALLRSTPSTFYRQRNASVSWFVPRKVSTGALPQRKCVGGRGARRVAPGGQDWARVHGGCSSAVDTCKTH